MRTRTEPKLFGLFVQFTCLECGLKSNWMRPRRPVFSDLTFSRGRFVDTVKIWERLHWRSCAGRFTDAYRVEDT